MKQSARAPVPPTIFIDAAGHFVPPGRFGMTTPESYKAIPRARLDRLLSSPKAEATPAPGRAGATNE